MAEPIIFIYSDETDEKSSKTAIPVESGVYTVPSGCLPFLFVNHPGSCDYVCKALGLTVDMCVLADEHPEKQEDFWSLRPMYICVESDIFKKHGFQMMGPGWKWIPDEARWEEVPRPSESDDWMWSHIQTWEKRCSRCGCGSCAFDLGEKSWMLDLDGAKGLFNRRSDNANFCWQEAICSYCNQCYNPTDPEQKKHHSVIIHDRFRDSLYSTSYCNPTNSW